jgi:L-aspartate oxidase
MRHVKGVDLHARFPGISAFLACYGFDLERDLIPVRPAAHYLMGGIRTDLDGRSTVRGLYAAGEAACTGVHGANRLASNSLLEGLVFGARAAKAMLADELPLQAASAIAAESSPLDGGDEAALESQIAEFQRSMWANAGLLREESMLRRGLAAQIEFESYIGRFAAHGKGSRRVAEAQAICRVARAIFVSALARTESRGAHYRNDFPRRDDERFLKHSVLSSDGTISFESWPAEHSSMPWAENRTHARSASG